MEVACRDQAWVHAHAHLKRICHLWEACVTCVLGCKNVPTEWFCFPFVGGPGFHLPRTSFYIHLLAQDSLNYINSASLESLRACGIQLEVLISHGKTFPSYSEPQANGNLSWHIPGLAAGVPLTSFFSQSGMVFSRLPFILLARWWGLGSLCGSVFHLLPRMGINASAVTGPISRRWGNGSMVFAPVWVSASFLALKNLPFCLLSLPEVFKTVIFSVF